MAETNTVQSRREITKFLGELLIKQKFTGIGKYWAKEVTLDYGHKTYKRIDFIEYSPVNQYSISGLEKGEFICYEVKSCLEDILSGYGLNFEGERNYIVTTVQTYKDLLDVASGKRPDIQGKKASEINKIPYYVGILVACVKDLQEEIDSPTPLKAQGDWHLEIAERARTINRKRSISELLFCMLRSWCHTRKHNERK